MTETINMETGEITDDEDRIADEMTPDDDEPEPDEPEPEPEPEPAEPGGPSEREVENAFKKLEQSAGTYARRVGELLDFMADDLAPCLLCASTPHLGFLNVRAAGTMPDEVKNPVMQYLGYSVEREYEPAPNIETCRVCKGYGKVSTGSRVTGNEHAKCGNCHGYGYFPPPGGAGAGAAGAAIQHAPADEAPPTIIDADTDPTGEPRFLPDGRENPNFGKWPQFKIQVQPWGTTAGLTAQDQAA